MSAPLVWVLLPAALSVGLFFLSRWQRISVTAGIILALLLSSLAWWLPIEETVFLGPWSFKLVETLAVLGRRLSLGDSDRFLLGLIYLLVAFWFGASYAARAGGLFVPLGLGMTSLLTAALAVEPFLYAALLIEMAVLVGVVLLTSPGNPAGKGVVRFLTLQTLGMPFILISGWMLAGVEASPGDTQMVMRAAGMIGFGFVLLLAVFPFHTWVPMITEQAHPYIAAFILLMLPWMASLFGLGFLDRYAWLRNTGMVYLLLRLAGVLMVLSGGLLAGFQRHLGRILGYAALVETGFSLLAAGLPGGLPLYFAMLLPRSVGFGVWALALATLQRTPESGALSALQFRSVQGIARKLPVASAGLVLAHFSVAGIPLLAGFPIRLALFERLAAESLTSAFLVFLGVSGLFVAGLRTLAVLVMGPDESQWRFGENRTVIIFIAVGILVLLVAGLFPHWILSPLAGGLEAFRQLAP